MFVVEFTGHRSDLVTGCRKYWAYSQEKGFLHDGASLAEELGVDACRVDEVVSGTCRAYHRDFVCDCCGAPLIYFAARKEFFENFEEIEKAETRRKDGLLVLCGSCSGRVPLNLNAISKEELIYPDQVQEIKEAFIKRAYESLSGEEFALLIELASAGCFGEACRQAGVFGYRSYDLLINLAVKRLIALSEEAMGYYLLPEMADALLRRVRPNSFFASSDKEKLYRVLKKKYGLVCPEVALSSFIDASAAQKWLNTPVEKRCFRFARVDFAVCDRLGIPFMAVDCPGEKVRERGDIYRVKAKILKAAGISHVRYIKGNICEEDKSF